MSNSKFYTLHTPVEFNKQFICKTKKSEENALNEVNQKKTIRI